MVSKNNPCFFLCSNSIRMPCPWRQIKKKSAGVNREGDWEKPVSQNHMRGKSYRQTDGGNLVPFMSPGIGFPSLMLWQAKTEAQRQGMGGGGGKAGGGGTVLSRTWGGGLRRFGC